MRRQEPTQVLQEAMAHFEVVSDYGSGDLSDQKTFDAICMRLSDTSWSSRRSCGALSTATCP